MSADAPQPPTKGEPLAAITRPYGALKDLDAAQVIDEINKVLGIEDPEFERLMAGLAVEELKSTDSLEPLETPSVDVLTAVSKSGGGSPDVKPRGSLGESFKQMREEFDRTVAKAFNGARELFSEARALIKTQPKALVPLIRKTLMGGVGALKKVPPKTVGKLLAVILLLVLCGFILRKTFNGGLFAPPKSELLTSLSQFADKSYEIEDDDEYEEFNSPLRHPEYVVGLEKIIVNLRTEAADHNPMGMFEFYIEAASRDAAIEISDRRKEVMDIMSRTVEKISYDDLVTFEGKTKLKSALAHDVNSLLTRGRVRRVYFKSIVLKP